MKVKKRMTTTTKNIPSGMATIHKERKKREREKKKDEKKRQKKSSCQIKLCNDCKWTIFKGQRVAQESRRRKRLYIQKKPGENTKYNSHFVHLTKKYKRKCC